MRCDDCWVPFLCRAYFFILRLYNTFYQYTAGVSHYHTSLYLTPGHILDVLEIYSTWDVGISIKFEYLITKLFVLQYCSNYSSCLLCHNDQSLISCETSLIAGPHYLAGFEFNISGFFFFFTTHFCGKIFFVLVVLPREHLAHHHRLTTSAVLQGQSVPTFHEGCLLETLSTLVSREEHGTSKAHHITLLQPLLPCLMALASSGDHQPQASSASSPPSLCAGENEWRHYTMCLPGALGDGGIGARLKVYEVVRLGNAICPKLF